MKAVFALCAALSLASLVQAQVFRPHSVRGDHGRSSLAVERHGQVDHRRSHGWHRGHSRSWDRHHHSHRPSVHVSLGVGSGFWHPYYQRPYVYRRPVYYPVPVYRDYGPAYYYDGYSSSGYRTQPGGAATGALLGGIAGAIIGNNSGSLHHDAWRGAALGAGAGLILGAVADNAARDRSPGERPPVYVQSREPAPAAAPAAQNVTIINNYYGSGSAMGSANRMFGR